MIDYCEMGGYLPLELNDGPLPWESLPPSQYLETNTGRTAIYCALRSLGVKRLLLPHYYCPDVIEMLEKAGVELSYYAIGPDMTPLDVEDAPGTAILLVNYFGLLAGRLDALLQRFDQVILDQCHAFFEPPVLRSGVMNVYSCRKFIGVSDGACLIGLGISRPELKEDFSHGRASHLLKCYEAGTNGAYAESKFSEGDLDGFKAMSPLTRRILRNADYDDISARRRDNARFLERRLADYQRLTLPVGNCAPYLYPLLLDRDLHRQMVQRRVYTPYLWAHLLEPEWNGTREQDYSRCILPLPIDQRYTESDMERLATIVEAALRS